MPFVLFNWVEKYHREIGAFYICSGLRPATLLKKRLWHRCFPVNFAKFLRTPFLIEHLWMTASDRDRKNYPGIYKTT